MGELPSYDLELRAADERKRLHDVVAEFRNRVHENLDLKNQLREHLRLASTAAAVVALGLGYSLAGLFVRH
ncbi:MAG TPA: hypothetical protein VFA90_17985 [Terriglobales bacterium]|nr:hypothetical protein [Terriglobales bacterium]